MSHMVVLDLFLMYCKDEKHKDDGNLRGSDLLKWVCDGGDGARGSPCSCGMCV